MSQSDLNVFAFCGRLTKDAEAARQGHASAIGPRRSRPLPNRKDAEMTYLAVARLTVGAEAALQKRELQEGLERVIEEMVGRDMTPAEIEAAFEDACAVNEVDL